jgi:two pore calcium channel protein 1/two pore calcium channel protein 3
MGLYNYFDDIWNKFDFSIIFLQIFFDFILINTISTRVSSSLKANRVLRLAKIQKIFRLFRAFRSFKLLNVFLDGLSIFEDVKELFYKIIMCIPVVAKFVVIIWVLLYSYAVFSLELLNGNNLAPSSQIICDVDT